MRARAEVAFLENGVNLGQVVGHGIVVVVHRGRGVIVGSREAVEHAAEEVALTVGANHLGQVARRNEYVLHLVDIAVLAGHVGADDLVAEDVGRLLCLVIGRARHHLEVAFRATGGNVVAGHLLLGEVYHHGARGIHHHVDALVVILLPIGVVHRHVSPRAQPGNGVDDVGTRGVLHRLALHHGRRAVADVRQHLHQDGVVEHRGVEQLFLHGVGQVFVAFHTPAVVGVETVESLVVGGEDGLRARLGQRLGIAQVVNQTKIIGESAFQHIALTGRQVFRVLHRLIDATAQPRRVVVWIVQLVVIRTRHESTTRKSQTGCNARPSCHFNIVMAHVLFRYLVVNY